MFIFSGNDRCNVWNHSHIHANYLKKYLLEPIMLIKQKKSVQVNHFKDVAK